MIRVKTLFNLTVVVLIINMSGVVKGGEYVITEKNILKTGIPLDTWAEAEIYSTDDNVYIVLNAMRQNELFLFSKISNGWNSAGKKVPLGTKTGIFSEQHKLRLYTIVNEPTSNNKRFRTVISLYEIDEAKIDLGNPATTIIIPPEKIFSNERRKTGGKLLPLSDKEGHYLLLGTCDQAKWDPLAVIGTVISGGHAGFTNWPFLAEIKDVNEIAYHKWPVNYGTNAVVEISQAVLVDSKYHFVGTWHKEYMPSHERIEYSFFDLKSSKWSKPELIYKEKGNYSSPCGKPAIQANDENIAIAWSLGNDDQLGSGLFAICKFNGTWGDTEKISSFVGNPLLMQDINGNMCVFWRESRKGILVSSFLNRKWSEPCIIVNDEFIDTRRTLWDIKSDRQGNFHLIYTRKISDQMSDFGENIMYVRLEYENSLIK